MSFRHGYRSERIPGGAHPAHRCDTVDARIVNSAATLPCRPAAVGATCRWQTKLSPTIRSFFPHPTTADDDCHRAVGKNLRLRARK